MSPFEYLLPLVSVLVGLAIVDLAVSLHRLLRARARVTWDWLALTTALLAALTVLNFWWGFYNISAEASADVVAYATFVGFLPYMVILVVLFLLNAAALPDRVPDEGLDLRAFYDANGRYFWALFTAYVLTNTVYRAVINTRALGTDLVPEEAGLFEVALTAVPNLVFAGLTLTLAWTRRRRVHVVLVLVILAFSLLSWLGSRLAVPEA